jgi:hypothetical protein
MVTLKLDPAKMQLISGFVDTYLNLNQQEESTFQHLLSTIELQEREQIMEITTRKGGRKDDKKDDKKDKVLLF